MPAPLARVVVALLDWLGIAGSTLSTTRLSSLDFAREALVREEWGVAEPYSTKLLVLHPLFFHALRRWPWLFGTLDLLFVAAGLTAGWLFKRLVRRWADDSWLGYLFALNPFVLAAAAFHDLHLLHFLLLALFLDRCFAPGAAASAGAVFATLLFLAPNYVAALAAFFFAAERGRAELARFCLAGGGALALLAGLTLWTTGGKLRPLRSCYLDYLRCATFMNGEGLPCEILFNTFAQFIPTTAAMLAGLGAFMVYPSQRYFAGMRARCPRAGETQLLFTAFLLHLLHLLSPYESKSLLFAGFLCLLHCCATLSRLALTLCAVGFLFVLLREFFLPLFAELAMLDAMFICVLDFVAHLASALGFATALAGRELRL